MDPSVEPYINLLIQVPLVGAFMWFVLTLITRFDKAQEKRDAEWRVFLADQRTSNNAALARLADEIKEIGQVTAGISESLRLHDQRVSMSIPTMQEAVNKIADPPRRRSGG